MRFLTQLLKAFFAQLNKLGNLIIGRDPIAVARLAVDENKQGIQEYAGAIETKKRIVSLAERELSDSEAKLRRALAANDEVAAKSYAASVAEGRKRVANHKASLANAEAGYARAIGNTHAAVSAIAAAKGRMDDQELELKESRLDANLAELNERIQGPNVDGILSGNGSIMESRQAEIDRNRGRARAISDLTAVPDDPYASAKAEEDAESILAEFRAGS